MQAGLHSSSHVESKLYRFGNPPDSAKVRSALGDGKVQQIGVVRRQIADRPRRLKPGTVLLREYQGERHTYSDGRAPLAR
jgi:hypothetical protein